MLEPHREGPEHEAGGRGLALLDTALDLDAFVRIEVVTAGLNAEPKFVDESASERLRRKPDRDAFAIFELELGELAWAVRGRDLAHFDVPTDEPPGVTPVPCPREFT